MSKEKIPREYYVQYRTRSGKGKLSKLRNSKWFTLEEAIKFAKEKQDGFTISNVIRATNPTHHLYGYIDKKKELVLKVEGILFSIYRCPRCRVKISESADECSCGFLLPVYKSAYEKSTVGRNIDQTLMNTRRK